MIGSPVSAGLPRLRLSAAADLIRPPPAVEALDLHQRLRSGKLAIETAPGCGFKVTITMPLAAIEAPKLG